MHDSHADCISTMKAVLLFYSAGVWTAGKQHEWYSLTGKRESTTKTLCDTVRETLERISVKNA